MRIDFWYDFASTYSYLAAMRIEALAVAQGVEVVWRPFLLGPILAEQGLRDSPFNVYRRKGDYMWRDMERLCARAGLPFRRPEPFPQNSLLAGRTALALDTPARAAFSRAVFHAEFGEGRAIDAPATLVAILDEIGLPGAGLVEEARSEPVKLRLKTATDAARSLGIFGAPTFSTPDGEIFWGNDRLDDALGWAAARR